ncbi:MAG: energy transducer TonB [Glaciecola sp.]
MNTVNGKGQTTWLVLIAFIALSAWSLPAYAQKEAFFAQYKQYQQQVEALQDEVSLAEQATNLADLASDVFGATHVNTVNLTISAANHYRNAKLNDKALELYDIALGLYKDSDNNNQEDFARLLIDVLSVQGNQLSIKDKTRLSDDLYDTLQDYFNDDKPTKDNVVFSLIMFNGLVESGNITRRMRSLPSLSEDLVALADKLLTPNASVTVRAKFNAGRLFEARKRKSDAIKYYTSVIDIIEDELEVDHPFALSSHARLVGLYESTGKSDEATKHCIAIGKMKPWDDNIEPTPLYRIPPRYPEKYGRKGKEGFAIIEFDISPSGFVENPKLLETNGSLFGKSSIEVLSKWRYAPKVIDGKTVTAHGRKVRLDFTMNGKPKRKMQNT